jgi:hypothetical protein
MSKHGKLLMGIRVMSVAFFLAFSGGTSLAEDVPSTAPVPNPSEGEVQERSVLSKKIGDLDITSVYGRCRFYNNSTGQTLCARKVCYIAKNLGPVTSLNFSATVRLGGSDSTIPYANYGPRRPLDTFGQLAVGVTTGERCKEFPDQEFLEPFQPLHYVVVELLFKLALNGATDPNPDNNIEWKLINYQTCQSQPGNQC